MLYVQYIIGSYIDHCGFDNYFINKTTAELQHIRYEGGKLKIVFLMKENFSCSSMTVLQGFNLTIIQLADDINYILISGLDKSVI